MSTSTNKPTDDMASTGGAFADGLTLIRALLTPIIMFIIYKAWSGHPEDPKGFVSLDLTLVLFASFLFAIAAITDILDDFVGGSADAAGRMFGWLDDVADSILVGGTLVALLWVTKQAGLLHWTFAIPALALIGRDILITVLKGYELSKFGFLETRLGDIKSGLAMLAACILVAAPWLSNLIDRVRVSQAGNNVMEVYNNASPWIWNFGLIILWAAAVLTIITGYKLLISKPQNEAIKDDSNTGE